MVKSREMIKNLILLMMMGLSVSATMAQDTGADSSKVSPVSVVDPEKPEKPEKSVAEPIDSSGITDMGVAVAPSIMHFRATPGKSETRYLTITNDQYKAVSFRLTFADFNLNDQGAATQLPYGEQHEYGLTRWIVADQTFIKLKPGEARKIAITVNLPDVPEAYRAAWAMVMVDLQKEREYIVPPKSGDKAVVMGLIPTYGFGIYIYQNPPTVTMNKVEIRKFDFTYDDKNRYVNIAVENVGDGIGFCLVYIEISNLNTGYNKRLPLKRITVLPGQNRELDIVLPGDMPKGKYSIMGVLDFGSDTELEAAEMEITVN